jgi:TPR repeat protein/actin-like ATPase involved in cell morphogenesis
LGTGRDDIPTVIYHEGDGQFSIGESAEEASFINPGQFLKHIKRHLGEEHRSYIAGKAYIAEDFAGEFLKQLLEQTRRALPNADLERAIFTTPVAFGPAARDALRNALKHTPIKEAEFVDEPHAAALAYAHDRVRDEGAMPAGKMLVFDWGGGTLDLVLLQIADDGQIAVDDELREGAIIGGMDIDEALCRFVDDRRREQNRPLLNEIQNEFHSRNLRRIIDAKELLSKESETVIFIEDGATTSRITLTREIFNDLIRRLCEEATSCAANLQQRCIERGLPPDSILLIGGSSKILLVQELLKTRTNLPVIEYRNCLSAVSLGAAIYSHETYDDPLTDRERYLPAAQKGAPLAAFKLYELYKTGRENANDSPDKTKEDRAQALRWCGEAAANGHAEAAWLYARHCDTGDLAPRNSKEAYRWYQNAATKGNATAKKIVRARKVKTFTTWCAALFFFCASSAAAYVFTPPIFPGSQFQLALKHDAAGRTAAAREWFEKAAAQNHAPAQFAIGGMFEKPSHGATANLDTALSWYQRAASNGSQPAKSAAARLTPTDPEKQYTLSQKYAAQNNAPQELAWLGKAATGGVANAQFDLAEKLLAGEKTDDAVAWFEKAAAQKHTLSESRLGTIAYKKQNYAVAEKWFEKAAAAGDAVSQYHLGLFSENGFGRKKDYSKALAFYSQAFGKLKDDIARSQYTALLAKTGDGRTIDVNEKQWDVATAGGNKTFRLTNFNGDTWNVETAKVPNWIKITPNEQSQTFAVTCSENTATTDRTTTIIVVSGGKRVVVEIKQARVTTLAVAKNNVSFTNDGGSETVSVDANGEFSVQDTLPSWATASKDGNAVKIDCRTNTTIIAREGTLSISLGEKTATIRISQAGKTPTLSVGKRYVSFASSGGSETVSVDANGEFSVQDTLPSWATASKDGNSVKIDCRANATTSSREGTLTVAHGAKTVNIRVSQAEKRYYPSVSPSSHTFSSSGGNKHFSITDGTPLTNAKGPYWTTISNFDNSGVDVACSSNSGDAREGEMKFTNSAGADVTVTIRQEGRRFYPSVSPSSHTFSSSGGNQHFTITDGAKLTYVKFPGWVTASNFDNSSGIDVSCSPNSGDARDGELKFTNSAGADITVTIRQEGAPFRDCYRCGGNGQVVGRCTNFGVMFNGAPWSCQNGMIPYNSVLTRWGYQYSNWGPDRACGGTGQVFGRCGTCGGTGKVRQ